MRVIACGAALDADGPVRLTSAAASAPRASATTSASARIGVFQLAGAASRVRAAAPHPRHHSWSACSGVPHSGQAASMTGRGACAGSTLACCRARKLAARRCGDAHELSIGGLRISVESSTDVPGFAREPLPVFVSLVPGVNGGPACAGGVNGGPAGAGGVN